MSADTTNYGTSTLSVRSKPEGVVGPRKRSGWVSLTLGSWNGLSKAARLSNLGKAGDTLDGDVDSASTPDHSKGDAICSNSKSEVGRAANQPSGCE